MILVQNHRLRLSGSKYFLLILLGLYLSSCSKKVRPNKNKVTAEVKKEEEKPARKFTQASISLLVPFKLNEFKPKTESKADIERYAMAIDFYQGFKMGIDSAAAAGLNFKVNVYDTRDDNDQLNRLFNTGSLLENNLIIGPVFPDGLKAMAAYSIAHQLPVVSPLAATQPSEFGNPNLISIVNNIDLHAKKMGNFIVRKYDPANTVVILINTRKNGDETLGEPLREYFVSQKASKFKFEEYASVFTMETKAVKTKKYVVMLSSSDRKFVAASIDKLVKMKKAGFNIDLFGHPDWVKQNYTTEKLQLLNTVISSSYKVNYKSPVVIDFVKKYRKAFSFEPSEYSFKGFDIGYFFGKQLSEHGENYLKYLTRERYKGLHNSFNFIHDPQYGYINTSLMLLKYKDYDLNIIE